MRWRLLLALFLSSLGCAHPELPLPPLAPPSEDLSTWSVPELVQHEDEEPRAVLPDGKPTPAERVYEFRSGATFTLFVALDTPLDILLERGEQVRNIVGGAVTPDPALPEGHAPPRWEVKEGTEGQGETQRAHIFVAATAAGLHTGFIVTTTRRTYYLACTSVKAAPHRVVRWHYPADAGGPRLPRQPGLLPERTKPTYYHVGYTLTSTSDQVPSWMPRQVVDDGKKTYILYPEVTLFETVPIVRLLGPQGPQLVNARQFLNVVILDQLVGRVELRVGTGAHAETVTITRGQQRTIRCPDDAACPVWPQAAAPLGRRTP